MEQLEVSNKPRSSATEMLNTLLSIGAEDIVESTLHKVIHYQLAKYRIHIEQMNREMETFEKNYNMTSEVFFREFEAGNLGDDGDFFEWGSLYENLLLYQSRVEKMETLNT